jgi:hypothetical protein
MNCDQVFNILTRGPFPTGEPHDHDVEAHLEICHECWRLAEALRPALDVFQEAVPPAEGRDLPGYWSETRPAAAVLAELTQQATSLAPATMTRSSTRRAIHPSRPTVEPSLIRDILTVLGFVTLLSGAVLLIAWVVTRV